MKHAEHAEQVAVVSWARLQTGRWPELRLLFAVPNGASLAGGPAQRARQMHRLKAEGLNPGVPDMWLPVARKGYHGLVIEMKAGANKPSDKQADWLDALTEQGYLALACWGADEAIDALREYLS